MTEVLKNKIIEGLELGLSWTKATARAARSLKGKVVDRYNIKRDCGCGCDEGCWYYLVVAKSVTIQVNGISFTVHRDFDEHYKHKDGLKVWEKNT
jgi:hypothetical protein